ncbi:RCC1 and BTB domain-containing protein 1-like isoform X2 [Planococcus citri]|uniref:RCC1 and BTB domain-containing protein 1-like isoform X2 n=1 Tax=Planococcus citri TaxID=170843 RepID=UPI0031F8AC6F
MDIRKYLCEWKLSDDFIERIETFAIWRDDLKNSNILFVMKNREVYAAEKFSKFCEKSSSLVDSNAKTTLKTEFYEPVKLSPLCGKRIKKFVYGPSEVFICTEEGDVFVHGYYYDWSQGKYTTVAVIPQKVSALQDLRVVDIAIGPLRKRLALCDDGKLYKFELFKQSKCLIDTSAVKAKPLNVLYVAGSEHNRTGWFYISLLDDGKVMKIVNSNGDFGNRRREKYRCEVMNFENAANPGKIVKLIQGYLCAFALDEYGRLFVTGNNANKQLGIDFDDLKCPMPCENFKHNSFITEKVVDIAASCYCSLSALLTESGKVYMWGEGRGGVISEPQLIPFESLHEVFHHYSSPTLVTYKPINVNELPASISKSMKKHDLADSQITQVECSTADAQNSLLDSLKKAFDDPKFCDLFVVVEGKTIPVHKSILAVRCEHFAEVFQNDWSIEKPSVLEIEDGDFKVYKAFLKYVYTDQMDDTLSLDELIELLNLSNKYNVKLLAERCISLIQPNITVENVISLYERVIVMSSVTKMKNILDQLKESCVMFGTENFFAIGVSDEFTKLNKEMAIELVVEVCKRKCK